MRNRKKFCYNFVTKQPFFAVLHTHLFFLLTFFVCPLSLEYGLHSVPKTNKIAVFSLFLRFCYTLLQFCYILLQPCNADKYYIFRNFVTNVTLFFYTCKLFDFFCA